MIKIENVEVVGWESAIRGMRNPMNSWDKSDSDYRNILCAKCDDCKSFKNKQWEDCDNCLVSKKCDSNEGFMVGPNDLDLMTRLRNSGTDHRKFMRMIVVYADVTAPLYWWKEADTYKVGTVRNSCSTMHKITEKEFTLDDFSHEHLIDTDRETHSILLCRIPVTMVLESVIYELNYNREKYLETKNKLYWWQIIQLLPSSYNQRATLMLNYEVLDNMYHSRKAHKLDEWRDFCKWIETLPYSELITGGDV